MHFQFDYAGLSFTAPQKVRYRYMLEGFDRDWTEAGARRSAYYTNIPPGRYTFRVQAANNDGLWNTEGAALDFELRPHFYQTLWFYALLLAWRGGHLVLLAAAAAAPGREASSAPCWASATASRARFTTRWPRATWASRCSWRCWRNLLRQNKVEAAAKHLDATRGYVREGLADARQSIWALRSQDSGETTLPVRLRRMVEAAEGNGVEARFSILAPTGRFLRVRNAKFCVWPRRPFIM